MKISKDQFGLYAECIGSGQIEQQDVPKLLAENPEFDAWYRSELAGSSGTNETVRLHGVDGECGKGR